MIPSKIARIIPRLATDHVGELVATRDALVRSLFAIGLDLHDLAAACSALAPTTEIASATSCKPSFGDMARACRDLDRGRLSPRERVFVAEMVRRGFTYRPSSKQADWLASIFDQLSLRAAA